MTTSLLLSLPEEILALAAVLCLLLGSFLPRGRQWVVRVVGAAACAGALAATIVLWGRQGGTAFEGSYAVDAALGGTRIAVVVAVLLVLCLATDETRGHARESEFVVLVLLSAVGAVLLAGSLDLLLLVAAYLVATIPLYALTAFAKDSPGTEAALKFYLLGALLSATMLFGVVLLLGAGGATSYAGLRTGPGAAVAIGAVAVLAGLLFKAGAAPAQFWVPDVTEGTRPAVAALVTTVPKIGALVAVYRFAADVLQPAGLAWPVLLAVVAAATMTLGNLAAFFQDNVRRLLAYSTISQVGYVLLAVVAATRSTLALPGLLYYLAGYAVTNVGAFAVVCALPRAASPGDYGGLRRRYPYLALCLVVLLLGFVGTPPTAVFAGKVAVFTAAWDAGYGWLVVVAAVNTVASVFYYLRWIAPAMRGTEPGDAIGAPAPWSRAAAYATAPATVALGLLAGPVLAVLAPSG
ncbi:NADH-quinone oxidoreductase subunit N [Prauserella muralis]|uniref:NADH-quinone oxidoreductase subunit N n=1 Tax=Prauserella muralis TaxID=588067 RepID=A0A2V4AGJ0_9PSEU|nr:proton-conducting transporter membrane subunit [Prauserella muralis]PXY19052.1 NADH-quinone oxidoreductase subunit N [Prauserella muralis]TWE28949.1 NADH dehydrogenase subunit N [Prauserella muralis]